MATILSHEPRPKNYSHHAHIEQYKRIQKGIDSRNKVTFVEQGRVAIMPSSDPSFPKGYTIQYGDKLNCECQSFINGNAATTNHKAELPKDMAKDYPPFKCYHIYAAEARHREIFPN